VEKIRFVRTSQYKPMIQARWRDDVGAWIEGDRDGPAESRVTGETIDEYWCSWCGYSMYWRTPYCPNCGAAMEGKHD